MNENIQRLYRSRNPMVRQVLSMFGNGDFPSFEAALAFLSVVLMERCDEMSEQLVKRYQESPNIVVGS